MRLIDADALEARLRKSAESNPGTIASAICELVCNDIEREPEQKTIRINLNETVKVKLTDFGRAIYRQGCDRLNEIIGEEFFCLDQLKEDKDGYVKFQLWSFMQQYGEYMGLGFPNVIEPLEIIWERRTDDTD